MNTSKNYKIVIPPSKGGISSKNISFESSKAAPVGDRTQEIIEKFEKGKKKQ